MKLNKQDNHILMLFEEYIDTLIDRRTFHSLSPENDITYEDRAVAAARTVLLNEVFKNDK